MACGDEVSVSVSKPHSEPRWAAGGNAEQTSWPDPMSDPSRTLHDTLQEWVDRAQVAERRVAELEEQKEADDGLAAWIIAELYDGGSWGRMEAECPEINAYVARIGAFAEEAFGSASAPSASGKGTNAAGVVPGSAAQEGAEESSPAASVSEGDHVAGHSAQAGPGRPWRGSNPAKRPT